MKNNTQQIPSVPKYHPFAIPPTIDLYIQHRNCSQFGQIKQQLSQQSCPCCKSPPRQILNLCCPVKQIYQISQPAGYYFNYIKLITGALVMIMLIIGIYTLIQIVNQCNQSQGQDQGLCLYVYGVPIPKIHVFFKVPLIILNIVVIIALYGFSAYLFFRGAYLHQKNICGFERSSDYSIMLSGYDHNIIKIEDLRQILSQYEVKDIIFTHKIKKYLKWLSSKSLLNAQLIRYRQKGSSKVQKIQKKIMDLDNLMLHTKNKLLLGQDVQFRTDKVIITFSEVYHKKNFQQIYGLTMAKNIYHTFCGGSPLLINNHPIFIQPLGEPNEIIWQNFQINSRSRYLRVLVSNLVTVALLFGSFVMVVYLSKGQQDQSAVGDALMSIVFAVLIEVINEFLTFAIDIFTQWQGRYTMTGQISVKLYKNCLSFFLNTTLLPFMLFILDLFHPEEDDIIRNILSIFFISNIVSPYVGLFLQPKYLLKIYRRRKIQSQGSQCLITQKKANQIFEKIDFILDERYALISQLIMNCMFYAAIFPIGIVITIIGMVITYWSSKWWILNYCSLPKFSYRLGQHMNIISCFYPTIYALGYAANIYMVPKEVQFDRTYSIYIAIATIPITILFIIFGDQIAQKWIFTYRKSITQCINQNKHKLIFSYKSLNPTTFFHSNLSIENQIQTNDIWNKLISYVTAKQSGIIINQDIGDNQSISSRNSRGSKLQETKKQRVN